MLPTFSDSILSRLPAESRAKAVALDNLRQASHAAVLAVNKRVADAYARRDAMEVTIESRISSIPQDRRFTDEIEAMRAPLKILDAEIAELKAEAGRAEREFQSHDCLEFAAKAIAASRQKLSHHKGPPAVKGDHRKIVAEARDHIADLQAQIEAVELAPSPSDDLRQRIVVEVDRLAEPGRPLIDHRDPESIASAIARAARTDAFAIWASRDEIVARLQAEIGDAPGAMTGPEKSASLADLSRRLLESERREEAAITAAAAAGTTIIRRRDADARALLDLEDL